MQPLARRLVHEQPERHVIGHDRVEARHHRQLLDLEPRILARQLGRVPDPVIVDELAEIPAGKCIDGLLYFDNFRLFSPV